MGSVIVGVRLSGYCCPNGGVTCPHHHQVGSVSVGNQTDMLSRMEQALENTNQARRLPNAATYDNIDYIGEQKHLNRLQRWLDRYVIDDLPHALVHCLTLNPNGQFHVDRTKMEIQWASNSRKHPASMNGFNQTHSGIFIII